MQFAAGSIEVEGSAGETLEMVKSVDWTALGNFHAVLAAGRRLAKFAVPAAQDNVGRWAGHTWGLFVGADNLLKVAGSCTFPFLQNLLHLCPSLLWRPYASPVHQVLA